MKTRANQAGLTLVELMVAMVISLLLLAGLVTVFGSMRTSFKTTKQLNQLVDQQQLASSVLSDSFTSAGYYPVTNRTVIGAYPTPAAAFPAKTWSPGKGPLTSVPFNTAGQVVYGTGATAVGSRDVVAVRMMTVKGASPLDCQGGFNTSTTPQRVLSEFWVDTSKNQLDCTVANDLAGTVTASTSPLVGGQRLPTAATQYGGVTSLVAVYGVDTDGNGSVDRYMSANMLNSSAGNQCLDPATGTGNSSPCWPYVRNVRLTVTFKSGVNAKHAFTLHRTITLQNVAGRNVEAGSPGSTIFGGP